MRKIIIAAFSVALIIAVSVSCTQYTYLPLDPNNPWFGGNDKVMTTVQDVAENVNTGNIFVDAINATADEETIGIKSIDSYSKNASILSRTVTTEKYYVVVWLNGYIGENGALLFGDMNYVLNVSTDDASSEVTYSYNVESSSIEVQASGADVNATATVGGFTGTIEGISISTDAGATVITVNEDSTATVKQNKYEGSYQVGNDKITEAGAESEGEGSKAHPYVLENAEDFENIDGYGDNVYLELGADITTTGATVTTNGVTLDLRGHSVTSSGTAIQVINDGEITIHDSENGEGITAKKAAFWAYNDGTIHILNGNYSGNDAAVLIGMFDGSAESITSGSVTIEDGVFNGVEGAARVYGSSSLVINDGTFNSTYNLVIMTNGSSPLSNYFFYIDVNGGEFNGTMIQAGRDAGYIAGGFYICNTGTMDIDNAVLNIDGGVGIALRAGTVNVGRNVVVNHTNNTQDEGGKVGDAIVSLDVPKDIVIDYLSDYPGADPILNNDSNLDVVEIRVNSGNNQ